MARLHSDGSLDTAFSVGTGFGSTVRTIGVRTDGKRIYVGGQFTNYNGSGVSRFVALLSDGSIDTGFDTGTGFNSTVRKLKLVPDEFNDVYIGGEFGIFNGQATGPFVLLDSTGQLQ